MFVIGNLTGCVYRGESSQIEQELELAQQHLDALEYEQAIALYEQVLTIDPTNKEALIGGAKACAAMAEEENNSDEAIIIFEQAVTLAEKAYGAYSQEIEIQTMLVDIYLQTGECCMNAGKYDDAIAYNNKVTELDIDKSLAGEQEAAGERSKAAQEILDEQKRRREDEEKKERRRQEEAQKEAKGEQTSLEEQNKEAESNAKEELADRQEAADLQKSADQPVIVDQRESADQQIIVDQQEMADLTEIAEQPVAEQVEIPTETESVEPLQPVADAEIPTTDWVDDLYHKMITGDYEAVFSIVEASDFIEKCSVYEHMLIDESDMIYKLVTADGKIIWVDGYEEGCYDVTYCIHGDMDLTQEGFGLEYVVQGDYYYSCWDGGKDWFIGDTYYNINGEKEKFSDSDGFLWVRHG